MIDVNPLCLKSANRCHVWGGAEIREVNGNAYSEVICTKCAIVSRIKVR